MHRTKIKARRSALGLERLETRATPAALTGSVVNGFLTLTGTDDAEQFQIQPQAAANSFRIVGQGTTTVNGQAAVTFTGVRDLRLDLLGGNDQVSLDATVNQAFILAGSLGFVGGDGNNSLTFGSFFSAATETVRIGGNLGVIGGSGNDSVSLQSGGGTTVVGRVTLNYGNGDSSTNASRLAVNGSMGLTVLAAEGDDTVSLTALSVAASARFTLGDGSGAVTVSGGGSFSAPGTSTVGGALAVTVGAGDGSFTANDTLRVGTSLVLDLGERGSANLGGFGAGSVTVGTDFVATADNLGLTAAGGLSVRRNTSLTGAFGAVVDLRGTTSLTGNLLYRGGAGGTSNRFAVDSSAAGPLTVGGSVTLQGGASGFNEYTIAASGGAPSTVGGTLTVTGGTGTDQLTLDNLRVSGNTSVQLSSGSNQASFGQGLGALQFRAALTVGGGNGQDSVQFLNASVSGATMINLTGGADAVTVADSVFAAFTLATGDGDDSLSLQPPFFGDDPSSTFLGRVSVTLGNGNDTLQIGTPSDPARSVAFNSVATFDGGAGRNPFDDEAANFVGSPTFTNFTDPTPDA